MFKKILKSTLILGAVGVVLGFALPYIATALGLSLTGIGITTAAGATAVSYSPLWLGAYFGAFGAVNAILDPVVNAIFSLFDGKHRDKTPTEHITKKGAVAAIGHAPAIGHVPPSADLAPSTEHTTKFQDRIGGSRSELTFQQKVDASRANSAELSV